MSNRIAFCKIYYLREIPLSIQDRDAIVHLHFLRDRSCYTICICIHQCDYGLNVTCANDSGHRFALESLH